MHDRSHSGVDAVVLVELCCIVVVTQQDCAWLYKA